MLPGLILHSVSSDPCIQKASSIFSIRHQNPRCSCAGPQQQRLCVGWRWFPWVQARPSERSCAWTSTQTRSLPTSSSCPGRSGWHQVGWSPGTNLGAFHGFSFMFFMSRFYLIMKCLSETGHCPSLKAGQLCAIKTNKQHSSGLFVVEL